MQHENTITFPKSKIEALPSQVYLIGHDNPSILTGACLEFVTYNFEKANAYSLSKPKGLAYFLGDDRFFLLKSHRAEAVLLTNSYVYAISLDNGKTGKDIIEMMHADLNNLNPKPGYVIINGFDSLLFNFLKTETLFEEANLFLEECNRMADATKTSIILTTSLFYPNSRNFKGEVPLLVAIWRSKILQINAREVDAIPVTFCEPVLIFKLEKKDLVKSPSGFILDKNTNLFEPI